MRHGNGIYVSVDGSKYTGEYKRNKKDGMGTLTDKEGNVIFSGQWVNGEQALK